MVRSRAYISHTPEQTHTPFFSMSVLGTIIVVVQGAQALVGLVEGFDTVVFDGLANMLIPIAVSGFLG
jgi:predicted Co/Zn/Cd cation transporter (cation efflux family)